MRIHSILPLITTLVLGGACSTAPDDPLAPNKAIIERFVEISNSAEWDRLAEIVAADFKRHSVATAGEPVTSLAAFVELQQGFLRSFPDQRVELVHMVAEGDQVAVRAIYSGTQEGPLGNFPATGNSVAVPFVAFFRIDEGKIAELWVEWDNIFLLTQLGLFPPPAPETP